MTNSNPSVLAVVLNWNNFDDTAECLQSLSAQAYPVLSTLIVDNGSTDGSFERLAAAWKGKAEFLRSDENLGTAAGYNIGIRAALERGLDYVLLLNNDVVLKPGLIEALLPAFEAIPRLATVSPIVTYYEDPGMVWFAGGIYNALWGLSRHRLLEKPLNSADHMLGRLYPTDYVPTCAAMTATAVFADVGLLDERFFLGHDDIDWGIRLKRAGYQLRVVGRPLVAHKISVSSGSRGSNVFSPLQAYHYARGSVLIGRKWARGWRRGPYLAGQVLGRLPLYCGRMIVARRPAGVPAYLRGLRDGLGARGDAAAGAAQGPTSTTGG